MLVLKIHDKPLLIISERNKQKRKHFHRAKKGHLFAILRKTPRGLLFRRNEGRRIVNAVLLLRSLSSSSSREQKLMGCCSRKWEFILEEKSDGKILPHSSSSSSSSSDEKDDGFGAAAPEKAKVVVPLAYRTPTRRFRGSFMRRSVGGERRERRRVSRSRSRFATTR